MKGAKKKVNNLILILIHILSKLLIFVDVILSRYAMDDKKKFRCPITDTVSIIVSKFCLRKNCICVE